MCTTEKPSSSAEGQKQEEPKEVSEEVQKLREDLEASKKEREEITDKYRRSLAESDNMRKRLTKQIEDAKLFGIQGFCKDLLEVADVLKKASEVDEKNSTVKDVVEGVRLTETQLQQVFRRHGLEVEDPAGKKFDPNKHEAMFQVQNVEMEPNTVVDVQKVGYLLHGRTIRPALVGVSKK